MKKPSIDFFDRYARYFELVGQLIDDNAHVLIIGANDGKAADPTMRIWRKGWTGHFIEPDPRAMESLVKNTEHIKHAYYHKGAVGQPGQLFCMTQNAAELYRTTTGYDGSTLTTSNREHIVKRLKKSVTQDERAIDLMIESFTPVEINVTGIVRTFRPSLVQIDIEGMDDVAVSKVVAFGPPEWLPGVLMYEHQHLSDEKRGFANQLLESRGFSVELLRNDTVAWRYRPHSETEIEDRR